MRLRLSILFAAVLALTLPTDAQRSIVNRTVVDRTHVSGRAYVNRSPKKIIAASENPSLLEGRGISATGATSDTAGFGEGVAVQDITNNNLVVASLFPFGEGFSIFTSGGGTGIVKPPPGATINPTDELANGLAALWLYNEAGSATSITEYVSGTQSAAAAQMVWGTLPAQTGLPLAGPYVDNITPAARATATFTQSSTVLKDNLFQGGYLGGATWALCFKPPDGTTVAYVCDNSAQAPPNPTSGAQAYGFLTYINSPGHPGWIGETLYDANGTNLTASTSGQLFQFNTSTLPWIFMVVVLRGGVSGGCDIYANLDASGNPITSLRLVKTIAAADCAHTMASSNAHNATGAIYGLNALGVWGTAGPVGAKEAMAYAAIWNRPLTETGAVNVGDSVTGGELFDLFAAPCRMTTNSGIGNATITASDPASFGDGLAVNGTASLSPSETASVSDNFVVNTGQTAGVHPRLFITQVDLPRLQSWAKSSNPIWVDILNRANAAKTSMDQVPSGFTTGDTGGTGDAGGAAGPTEMAAELFAFMSLVDPNVAARADWAQRAHDLVMYVFNRSSLGFSSGTPWRDPNFPVSDRGRNFGEAFALVVDWCYSTFTAPDKATIKTTFKLWCNQCNIIGTAPNRAVPLNDSRMIAFPDPVKIAANNYWNSNGARNIFLFATALDPADDLDGSLTTFYLNEYWGRWQFVRAAHIATYGAGSLSPEGQEYAISSQGSAAMSLVAARRAGYDDQATYGPQTRQLDGPYWVNYPQALLQSFSSGVTTLISFVGPDLLPQNMGDIQDYRCYDPTHVAGSLALWAMDTGNAALLNECKWLMVNVQPGGAGRLAGERASFWDDGLWVTGIIFHFMTFDPAAASPVDPRPGYPTDFLVPGFHFIGSRTGWDQNATWFTSSAQWVYTNHELLAAGMLGIMWKNDWMIRTRDGYGIYHGCSDNCNSLSLQSRFLNSQNGGNTNSDAIGPHGGQWYFDTASDPIVQTSFNSAYAYEDTDMHGNYQSARFQATDVTQAWRTTMWLKPAPGDTTAFCAVYDRAKSSQANQFKRQEWSVKSLPTVSGNVATVVNPSGSRLYMTSVLPAGATLTPYDPLTGGGYNPPGFSQETGGSDTGASSGGIKYRLRIEDASNPTTVRMLTVLQVADPGVTTPVTPAAFSSSAGTVFDGCQVATGGQSGTVAILFMRDPSVAFAGTTFTIPAGSSVVYVTGLAASSGYTVTNVAGVVTIASGGPTQTDSGGVLTVTP